MLNQLLEQAREETTSPRKDPPTENRVKAAVMYHLGLSYRFVGPKVSCW